MSLILGCIADDFTGATDLASMLVRAGLRTILLFGALRPPDGCQADAMVIALRTRSIAAKDAVAESKVALQSLRELGARRFYFKYCSTFDSTDTGNIGPVAEALVEMLGAEQTFFCPAFPENGRTVYLGHLFVGEQLLNESGMAHHPLTPMKDANLVRILRRQSTRKVGLLPFNVVSRGSHRITLRCAELRQQGAALVICDAITDEDLRELAHAAVDWPLVTGSSAMAYWLAEAYRDANLLNAQRFVPKPPNVTGLTSILAGSCSPASCRQVEAFQRIGPALCIEPKSAVNNTAADAILDWAHQRVTQGPILVYSSVHSDRLRETQREYGDIRIARAMENTFARVARGLVNLGIRRLVVAGGETAGAVVQSLGIAGLSLGPEIEPGIPWSESLGEPRLALALKSGNFGSDDFFQRALEMLP